MTGEPTTNLAYTMIFELLQRLKSGKRNFILILAAARAICIEEKISLHLFQQVAAKIIPKLYSELRNISQTPNNPRHFSLCEYLLLKDMCIIRQINFSFPLGSNFHELFWCMQLGKNQVSVTENFIIVFLNFFPVDVRKNHTSEIQRGLRNLSWECWLNEVQGNVYGL